jgi:1,2-diacylglycerol 3-beta-galactosyltransferase
MAAPMTDIALVYFDAGGGHRSAASSIQEAFQRADCGARAELVNLQELLEPIDFIFRLTGVRVQDVYNRMLRNGWTLGSPQLMRALQGAIRIFHDPSVRLLEKHWGETKPDMVVSFVPHFNRALCESFGRVRPGQPFVTILTDFADYPPHFWIERQQQFLVCGTDKAVQQARQMGHRDSHIFHASGMILGHRFYELAAIDRGKEREMLGLDAECITGIVFFGGQGVRKTMMEIDRRLGQSRLPIQLIFICGRNQELVEALRAQKSKLPRFIEGFTSRVPYYMQLADFFIGKPGPGSLAEAMAMRLPVIVERNAWTLPQERYNADWVTERGVGLVVRNFSRIADAVSELIANLPRFRQNTAATENRALFEIVEILRAIAEDGTNESLSHLHPQTANLATR